MVAWRSLRIAVTQLRITMSDNSQEKHAPPQPPKFDIGTEVRVTRGVYDPLFSDFPVEGWVGIVKEISDDGEYLVEWNQETLDRIEPNHRARYESEDFGIEDNWFEEGELELNVGPPSDPLDEKLEIPIKEQATWWYVAVKFGKFSCLGAFYGATLGAIWTSYDASGVIMTGAILVGIANGVNGLRQSRLDAVLGIVPGLLFGALVGAILTAPVGALFGAISGFVIGAALYFRLGNEYYSVLCVLAGLLLGLAAQACLHDEAAYVGVFVGGLLGAIIWPIATFGIGVTLHHFGAKK